MKPMQWRTCAWAAFLPLAIAAHAAPAEPTNSAAGGSLAVYDSAFTNYRPAGEAAASPDKGWRAANDAVAAKPGEGHMMGMEMGHSMDMSKPSTADVKSSTGGMMVMPDGTSMPMSQHHSMPMDKGMTMRMEKGMKMPAQKNGKMPIPTEKRTTVVKKGVAQPMAPGMQMPMPAGGGSMQGMNMPHDHQGKGQ
jgi:hypothetical protein